MSSRLVIVGAGGFGRGVYAWSTSSPGFLAAHAVGEVVFVDDAEPSEATLAPVISTVKAYEPASTDLVLCAIANPRVREGIVDQLEGRGATFATFVDDRAVLAPDVKVGLGSIVVPGSVIGAAAVLGRQVHVNFNCSIGHDVVLGDFTTLSPAVNIMGQVSSGARVFYGGSATVLPRLTVGRGATVGAAACVTRDVPEGAVVVGVPASKHGGSVTLSQSAAPPQDRKFPRGKVLSPPTP